MTMRQDDQPSSLNDRSENQYERLQDRLDGYGEEDVVEIERLGETLADIETEERYKLTEEDANDLLSFYITTSATIEQESVLIINAYSFDFGVDGRDSIGFLEEHLTQNDREEMLYCLGLIDSGLKGELARVRRRRNELAHSNEHDKIEDVKRVKNDIKRAKEAKDKLNSIGVTVEQEMTGVNPEQYDREN